MFKAIDLQGNDEVRADVLFAAQGFGIFGLAMVATLLGVPAVVTVPALLVISGVCAHQWVGKRLVKVDTAV